jgi:hypothetical protein
MDLVQKWLKLYERYQSNTEGENPRFIRRWRECPEVPVQVGLSRRPIAVLNFGSGLLQASPG